MHNAISRVFHGASSSCESATLDRGGADGDGSNGEDSTKITGMVVAIRLQPHSNSWIRNPTSEIKGGGPGWLTDARHRMRVAP